MDFSRQCALHPPLYLLCVKAMEWAGVSDFALRLPAALCGLATVYFCWRNFSRLYDRSVGLLAAAFVAGNAMQIWHVRQVRPDAVLMLLFVFSLFFLLRFLRSRRNADLCILLAVNMPLFLLHYMTFLIVLAEGTVLALNWRSRAGEGVSTRQLFVFGLGTAVVALPVLFFLFLPNPVAPSILTNTTSVAETGRQLLDDLAQVLWRYDELPVRLLMGGLVIAGAVAMLRRAPRELAACLLLGLIPALALVFLRKATLLSPHLFLYLTVLAGLFIGQAGRWLPNAALAIPAALALAAAPAAGIVWQHAGDYYEATSYHQEKQGTDFKPMARELAGRLHPGDIVAASAPSIANAVSWYLDQYVATNPFRIQRLDAATSDYSLYFFATSTTRGQFGTNAMGPIANVEPILNATLYRLPIHRESTPTIAVLPFAATRRMEFPTFYRQVSAFTGMTIAPNQGGKAIPTQNNLPGTIEYRFNNATGDAPQLLQWSLAYENQGRENTLAVSVRFDDEPARPILSSTGPDARDMQTVTALRTTPYKTLTLSLQTVCAPLTARYPGGNLETIAVKSVQLEVVPAGLFDSPGIQNLAEQNLGKIEHNETDIWRWGLGPQSQQTFALPATGNYWLEFDFSNILAGQTVTVAVNGQTVAIFPDLPANAQESRRILIAGQQGRNSVTVSYSDWNHGKTTFAETDPRPLSLLIHKLRVIPE